MPGEFDEALSELGVDHHFTCPFHLPPLPAAERGVERKVRNCRHEYRDHRMGGDGLDVPNLLADEWNHIHGHARRHQSLGYLTPAESLGQRQEANGCGDDVSTT